MRLAIMQPYFLPYIGYFQLINAVDKFVILDDVNYINRGWINRNRLPDGDGTRWLTLPLVGASQNRLIRDISICPDDGWKAKMLRTVQQSYAGASEYDQAFHMFQEWLNSTSENLSDFLYETLMDICRHCGICTEIVPTSMVYPKGELKGQQRILDICMREKATVYLNPPGGKDLYDASLFAAAGVELLFLQPAIKQLQLKFSGSEGPVLSILDLLMRNSPDALQRAVQKCDLVRPVGPTIPTF